MIFDNQGIKVYDVSLYQVILFEYINNKRVPLPVEKQKHIDFQQMKKKASACIIKAGQRDYADPAFEVSWRNAKQAGLPRGTYWFCDKYSTPKSQAKLYWDLIKTDAPEGVVAVDFETGAWTDLNNLYVFINELQQISGLPDNKIVVYTNYYYFMEATRNAEMEWFSQFPLWIASYTSNPSHVKIPPVWETALLWQYGTPVEGLEAGVHSKEIDGNYFNGSQTEFEKFFGKQSTTIPENPVSSLYKKYFIMEYANKKVKLK